MILKNKSDSDEILTSTSDHILKITLNKPQKKNALSNVMYDRLTELLKHSEEDSEIHIIVLTGSGDYFTAGNDIAAFQSGVDLAYNKKSSFYFMNALATFKKPIIAAVNGNAIGIGVTLLLHCDLIYATDSSDFTMPFLSLGLVPEFASTRLLTEILGHSRAAELLMIGEKFDSVTAERLGIINKVVTEDELMSYVYRNARTLASKPTKAVQTTKRLMKKRPHQQVLDIIDEEAREFSQCLRTPETQSIVATFLNKKKLAKKGSK